jgi:hypothetical protein
MRNNICLLLTSTIEIQNKSLVQRNNTQQRLRDYKEALRSWLTRQKSISKIVFVDNSGYPLEEFKVLVESNNNLFNKQIEFLSCDPYEVSKLDRSGGELKTIDYALEKSEIMKDCAYFAKITGRLFIRNIDKIVDNLPNYFHIVSNFSNNLTNMMTVLIFFDKGFYKEKIAKYSVLNVNDQKREYIERVYAKAGHRAIGEDYRWFPFSHEPIIDGMSGTKDRPYKATKWYSFRGTLFSRFYNQFYRNAYRKNDKHILEVWDVEPEK